MGRTNTKHTSKVIYFFLDSLYFLVFVLLPEFIFFLLFLVLSYSVYYYSLLVLVLE